jgi:DNA-directed RNA polymerase subunit E'/Rpb7
MYHASQQRGKGEFLNINKELLSQEERKSISKGKNVRLKIRRIKPIQTNEKSRKK